MIRICAALGLLVTAGAASAASQPTDFGVRAVGGSIGVKVDTTGPASVVPAVISGGRMDISGAVGIGRQWGRVTSTYRSPAHNRRVGGVRNSYHLSGRAIDIARRPGVSHWQIAAAYRAAGYTLIESLDEGDHSHFAFGGPGQGRARVFAAPAAAPASARVERVSETRWRMVFAPPGSSRGAPR